MRRALRHHRKMMTIILIFLMIIISDFCLSNLYFMNTNYEISTSKPVSELRIVHLSDLHNSEFGKDNQRLIKKIEEQKPDIVCITGDLLNLDEDNTEIAVNLISDLANEYAVFVSLGNHETEYRFASSEELKKIFEQAGAQVLDFTYKDVTVKGAELRIGGFYGYGFPEDYEAVRKKETDFLKDFQDTDAYKILLTHMPFAWYRTGSLDFWDADLVLAGHTHGGQIRFPFIGGLYAPDLGWFPGQECGLYYSDDKEKVMVLSRGLGCTERIPRFHNVPEMVTININPK